MTNEEVLVGRLRNLGASELAVLRGAIGKRLGEDFRVFQVFTKFYWPLRDETHLPRLPCYLIATLYPWHAMAGGHDSLGAAMGKAASFHFREWQREANRLEWLLQSDGQELALRLLEAIRRLARKGIPIEWAKLLRDVCQWNALEGRVQCEWARDFLKHSSKGGSHAR